MLSARWRRSPLALGLLMLAAVIALVVFQTPPAGAAQTTFPTAKVLDYLYVTDPVNPILRHNVPNLEVMADGKLRTADFKAHYERTGGPTRWGFPISEVFEEEPGTLTQYYQRGAADFHKRKLKDTDPAETWLIERRLTWDYVGGGLGGSPDMGYEPNITNSNAGTPLGTWGHKISDFDITGKNVGFRKFFDSLGGSESFGFPKTDAREDTGAPGMLLNPGSSTRIVRQYFQAAIFEFFPNNAPAYRVQLTLLGDYLRNLTYPNRRWESLVPFMAAPQLTKGGSFAVVAVDRTPPTPVATVTPIGATPTPSATPAAPFDPKKELIVVGTRTKGVSVFDGSVWKTVNVEASGLVSNLITALFVDSERRVWLGTDAGLIRLNSDLTLGPVFRVDNSGIGENVIKALAGQIPGTLWIGHGEKGASSYSPASQNAWSRFRTDTSSIPSNSVRDLFMQDVGQNRVWMATGVGAARYDGSVNEWRVLKTANGLVSDDVLAVAIGPEGTLWFGTNGAGLNSTPSGVAGSWTTYTTSNGLGSNIVRDILVAADGTIWLATAGGVSRKGTAELSFSTFNDLNSGLVNNDVRSAAQDSAGNLWFVTGNGVSRYDPKTKIWKTFRTADGVADNDILTVAVVPKG